MRLLLAIALGVPLLLPAPAAAQNPRVFGAQQRAPARDPSTEKPGTSVIRGKVTSGDTARPLRRAQIRVMAPELTAARTASTNTQGNYEIRDLPAGRYTITVTRSGYLPMQYGQRRPGESAKPLQVIEAQTVERVDFVMPRAGAISGRVTDETGEAFAAVNVWALQAQYFRGRRRLVPTGQQARTDDTGQYRLLAVTPGDYVIMARIRETWTVEGDVKEVYSYLPSYFPGTGNAAEAQRVKVAVGQEVGGIDFAMLPGRVASVSGTAFRSDGAPLSSVMVMEEMTGRTMMSSSMVGSAKVGADGAWTLKEVPPGEYRLSAEAGGTGDPGRPAESATTTISVTGTDLDGVSLVADAGGVIAGQVVTDDGGALPPAVLKTRVSAQSLGDAGVRFMGGGGQIDAEGKFELTGVRGPSLIRLNPPQGWAIKSVDIGGRDYVDAPFEVRGGRRIDGARIVLTSRFPSLAGRIVDARANAADGTVILFPADASKWIEDSGAARGSRPDQSGTFRFQSVRPGDYLVIALDYVESWQWSDPEFLESLRDRATRLTLGEGEIEAVTLTLKK
ncbi:MAG: hypothetical protein A3H96_20140 [Acidobacteria bacterium RIFCSPLOWO2_02_FULL_67_36]|nr:MAG: hypothetical protein A3H96_20140 [Acidobacteria bacterium RIFCSPLOWO2_02_FULL_67_36]OFW23345.1 MAG: hypothetical protein A3G21_10645 [Acidobacteria bacterium RIFCSPLOWO2_12_FULL_66_21]